MATTTKTLACECGREIPVLAFWTALSRKARLACSVCKRFITAEYVASLIAKDQKIKAVVLAYVQIINYGWTSSSSLENEGVELDPHVMGGVLSGLQRAGLIQRLNPAPKLLALDLVEPKPIFVRGPRFPMPRDLSCQPIPNALIPAMD